MQENLMTMKPGTIEGVVQKLTGIANNQEFSARMNPVEFYGSISIWKERPDGTYFEPPVQVEKLQIKPLYDSNDFSFEITSADGKVNMVFGKRPDTIKLEFNLEKTSDGGILNLSLMNSNNPFHLKIRLFSDTLIHY